MYVNELNYLGNELGLTAHSYADDTTLYIGFDPLSEFEDVYERLNCCLQKVQHWMTLNFLKLNVDKSQLLVCGKKRLVKVHQSPISRLHKILKVGSDIVYSSKILGVILDNQLYFNHMVNDTCKTCFFQFSKLKNLRHFLSHDMKIMLVKSLVISRLDYCNFLYSVFPQICLIN